jgi:hypothetical protein
VNPIDVWEGIDTHEEQGHNRLVKLALHILSVIANSAGCEQAFSHMGLVHTAIRSKLGVDKVCKTTIIGMDIKRSHIEAGLAHSRGHRNFKAPTATTSSMSSDGHRRLILILVTSKTYSTLISLPINSLKTLLPSPVTTQIQRTNFPRLHHLQFGSYCMPFVLH